MVNEQVVNGNVIEKGSSGGSPNPVTYKFSTYTRGSVAYSYAVTAVSSSVYGGYNSALVFEDGDVSKISKVVLKKGTIFGARKATSSTPDKIFYFYVYGRDKQGSTITLLMKNVNVTSSSTESLIEISEDIEIDLSNCSELVEACFYSVGASGSAQIYRTRYNAIFEITYK